MSIAEGLTLSIEELEKQLLAADAGSEEQRTIAAALKELYTVRLNEEKNAAEFEKIAEDIANQTKELALKTETAKRDLEIKEKAAADDKVIKIVGITVPIGFSLIEMLNQNHNFRTGLNFEINNVVGSTFVRSIINTVMRKKK